MFLPRSTSLKFIKKINKKLYLEFVSGYISK